MFDSLCVRDVYVCHAELCWCLCVYVGKCFLRENRVAGELCSLLTRRMCVCDCCCFCGCQKRGKCSYMVEYKNNNNNNKLVLPVSLRRNKAKAAATATPIDISWKSFSNVISKRHLLCATTPKTKCMFKIFRFKISCGVLLMLSVCFCFVCLCRLIRRN